MEKIRRNIKQLAIKVVVTLRSIDFLLVGLLFGGWILNLEPKLRNHLSLNKYWALEEQELTTKPKTTPECEQLMNIVLNGLKANPFEYQKRKNAEAALERLSKKRCTKAIEYIMDESSNCPPIDAFAQRISEKARKSLI